MLGYDVAESTVAKYMVKRGRPPSPSWKAFLKNHSKEIVACDFFTVPTATFRVLYGFVILSHDRRRVLHYYVTARPTAEWAAQQFIEAFPYDAAARYLLRDNDAIYGEAFRKRVESLGIQEVRTAYQSPWQNGYVERLIGSVRRECLDHVIVFEERHLLRLLRSYFHYYHESQAHLSLDGDTPTGREVESPGNRDVIAILLCGGLHHRYTRAA